MTEKYSRILNELKYSEIIIVFTYFKMQSQEYEKALLESLKIEIAFDWAKIVSSRQHLV